MIHRYEVTLKAYGARQYNLNINRLYIESQDLATFFPQDDDAGTPARLEIGGHTSIEFEDEATFEELKP